MATDKVEVYQISQADDANNKGKFILFYFDRKLDVISSLEKKM